MSRGPTVPIEECLKCGGVTLAVQEGQNGRHRIQIRDKPPDSWFGDSAWGQLCPECWAEIWELVTGNDPEELRDPPESIQERSNQETLETVSD